MAEYAISSPGNAGLSDKTFKRLAAFIESELGIRMPDTKRVMLESRLQKRLRILGMNDYDAYLDKVDRKSVV